MNLRLSILKAMMVLLICTFSFSSLWAQAPEKMSYQAVVRNTNSALITNTQVKMQISILQGSASGTALYVETQTPTTNANGLISVEIGAGTLVSGDFTTIDWANGLYFIHTETDPTGGTDYSIVGTSQLLSVPYALHAKTAESLSGTITETDPVFAASVAASIQSTDTANWNNKLDTETDPIFAASIAASIQSTDTANWNNKLDSYTETDPLFAASVAGGITTADTARWNESEASYTGGTGIGIDSNNVISAKTYNVGDSAHGGIVFWVDQTGQHGLVCAKTNQSEGIRWNAGTSSISTHAKGDGPLAGKANTTIIIAVYSSVVFDDTLLYAARLCNELIVNQGGKSYGDWYLPSKAEMRLILNNAGIIDPVAISMGGTALGINEYWTSTEHWDNTKAWFQSNNFGGKENLLKTKLYKVRAVRTF